MKPFNLSDLRRVQQYGAELSTQGGRVLIITPPGAKERDGLPRLYLQHPVAFEEREELAEGSVGVQDPTRIRLRQPDPAYPRAVGIIEGAVRLVIDVSKIRADRHLTDQGRTAKLADFGRKDGGAYAAAMARDHAGLQLHARVARARHSEFYAVPRIAAGDYAGAMTDSEIRRHWQTLSSSERAQALLDASQNPSGQAAAWVPALLRSPIPLNLPEGIDRLLQSAWTESVVRTNPVRAAELADEQEAVEWALAVARPAAEYAGTILGDKRAVYGAVREIEGGATFFDIAQHECEAFEAMHQAA